MATNNAWNSAEPMAVTSGGTGLATITGNAICVGAGTSAITPITPGTGGQILLSGGASADPKFVTPTVGTGLAITTNATTLKYGLTIPAIVTSGGTGVTAVGAAYTVICGGTTATGALQNVASVGTSTQTLTSNGASALPSFKTAPTTASNWIKLSTIAASNSATVAFTSLISATYLVYMVVMDNVYPVTDAVFFNLGLSTDNGATYLNTNFISGVLATNYNSTTLNNNSSTTTAVLSRTTIKNAAFGSYGYSSTMYLYGLDTTATSPIYYGNFWCASSTSGNLEQGNYYGYNTTTTAVTAINFSMSGGNIDSGTFTLYGLTK